MKKIYKIILLLMSAAVTALCVLPIMSAHSGGTESCDLIVRGYNLMEFSALGIVPVIAPLLIVLLAESRRRKDLQEIHLIWLLCGNLVCYVQAVNAAKDWLYSVCDSRIIYHPALLIYPFLFVGLSIYAFYHSGHSARPPLPIITSNTTI